MQTLPRRILRCLLLVGLFPTVAVSATPPPDILLVTLDTTRADRIGCYGYSPASTPNIDRLAGRGLRFARAISPSPLTLPSHATLMTGRSPRELAVHDNSHSVLAEDALTLAEILSANSYRTSAFVASAVLDRSSGISQGFDEFDDQVRLGPRQWFGWTERGASQVASAVIDNLPEKAAPFFLWVHFYDPHRPFVAPIAAGDEALDPYDAEIAFVDRELGRILSALQAQNLDDNLVIVVAGDHGESLGEHGEDAHGIFIYQATQSVPMILAGPGIPSNVVVDTNAGLIDLAPTLLTLAGIEIPPSMSGRSLIQPEETPKDTKRLRAWIPTTDAEREYELESRYGELSFGWSPLFGVIRERYKFIQAPEAELFDLWKDPQEKNNVIDRYDDAARMLETWLEARFGPPPWMVSAREDSELADTDADPDRLERLASLGYVSTKAPHGRVPIDPKRGISSMRSLAHARRLISDERAEEAIPILESIVGENRTHVPAWLTLGNAFFATGDTQAAVEAFEKAAELDRSSHLPPFNLGRVWFAVAMASSANADAADRAVHFFRQSLERHPRHADSVQRLAEALLARGNAAKARAVLQKAVTEEIVDEEILILRGRLEAHSGNRVAAKQAFEDALLLNSNSADALSNLGRLAYVERDYQRAVEAYRRSLEVKPSALTARTLGSILLEHFGDIGGAVEAFETSLELDPNGPESPAIRQVLADLRRKNSEKRKEPSIDSR